ncbi:MAG: peptide deformylase [Desulfobacteraceae bacterium]|jgi:peptide deformylase
MAVKEILLLGNPKLYELSEPVEEDELASMAGVVRDLHDTLLYFRKKHSSGRAITAPQIGVMKRLIYMFIDEPVLFINPVLTDKSDEMITLWDDCMSFPDLLVRVKRHKSCTISYKNLDWEDQSMILQDDLSELLQHEYDHLDGILAVARALDGQSLALKSQKRSLNSEPS